MRDFGHFGKNIVIIAKLTRSLFLEYSTTYPFWRRSPLPADMWWCVGDFFPSKAAGMVVIEPQIELHTLGKLLPGTSTRINVLLIRDSHLSHRHSSTQSFCYIYITTLCGFTMQVGGLLPASSSAYTKNYKDNQQIIFLAFDSCGSDSISRTS